MVAGQEITFDNLNLRFSTPGIQKGVFREKTASSVRRGKARFLPDSNDRRRKELVVLKRQKKMISRAHSEH